MISSDREQIHALSQRILTTCAHKLGGTAALAKHLAVSELTLTAWLTGKQVPPVEVIMQAISPLIGESAGD